MAITELTRQRAIKIKISKYPKIKILPEIFNIEDKYIFRHKIAIDVAITLKTKLEIATTNPSTKKILNTSEFLAPSDFKIPISFFY